MGQVEERLCDVLTCLVLITANRQRESLPYEEYIPVLLQLLEYKIIIFSNSSCRCRRLICRIFRQLLPYTTPQAIDKLLESNKSKYPDYPQDSKSNIFFLSMLNAIWDTVDVPHKIHNNILSSMTENRYNITSPTGYGCGLPIRAYRCEVIYLFRHLLLV